MKSLVVFGFLIAALVTTTTQAGLIALGLDWRKNFFVQEVWRDGVPSYQIANRGKEDITLSLYDRKGENLLAGPWVILGNNVLTMDVNKLVGQDLIVFKFADGTSPGMMRGPVKVDAPKGTNASYDGLNGSGGRHGNLWIEQPAASVVPGEVFEITLKIPAKVGVVKYFLKPDANTIPELTPVEVICPSLTITKNEKMIEIDTGRPTKEAAIHVVTLRFRAPAATSSPTMVMVNGWHALPGGGGHGITRGIVVSPVKGK